MCGGKQSNESDILKPFVDIEDGEQFRQPKFMNAYDSLDSEDLFDYISDSDGKIVRFKIENSGTVAYSRGKIHLIVVTITTAFQCPTIQFGW